jgi:hypothetical protein
MTTQASLELTNVFNKFYYNSKVALTCFNISGSPARPCEFLLSIKRDF